MPFFPNSTELLKNNASNIEYMAVLIFLKFIGFDQNSYFRTSSWSGSIMFIFTYDILVKRSKTRWTWR